jgi:GntR family transcriptional regulator
MQRLKHEEIAAVLEREIRGGSLPTGDQLPGETALAERFSVSRNTIRAALSELGQAGLISTRSGKGSFVTFDGRPLSVRLGWARALQEQGVDATITVLALETVDDPALAAELGLDDVRFLRLDRLRTVGSVAVSRESSRIPCTPAVVDAVTAESAAGSLTAVLREAGLVAATGEQWVEVRAVGEETAALLGRTASDLFLWSRCVTRTAAGDVVECVESLLDPAHFRLHFEFDSDS